VDYENTVQHPDADAVMKREHGALTAIALLAGKSEIEFNRPKRGGHQEESLPASERKQLYSTLYGGYTEAIQDLTVVLKESAAKRELPRAQLLHLRP
jgi:hypothetical protein